MVEILDVWRVEDWEVTGGLDPDNVNLAVGMIPLVDVRPFSAEERARVDSWLEEDAQALEWRKVTVKEGCWGHYFKLVEPSVTSTVQMVTPAVVPVQKPRGFWNKLVFLFSK